MCAQAELSAYLDMTLYVPDVGFTPFLRKINTPGSQTRVLAAVLVIKMGCADRHPLGHVAFGKGAGREGGPCCPRMYTSPSPCETAAVLLQDFICD